MRLAIAIIVILGLAHYGNGAGNQYVQDGSVSCTNEGITFLFSEDSDLYDETGLQIRLYTGNDYQQVRNYVPGTDSVDVEYADGYTIVATTVYGSNGRPLLYNIEQPFYAVPISGKPRNYTFGVYCTVQAYDNINVTTNTTDNGHGNDGGDVINPQDHVDNQLLGTKNDGSSVIGDPLEYVLFLKDDTYSALLPVNCKYYNPSNEVENLPFVSNSCPRPYDDPEGYFGTFQRLDEGHYQLNFRAFTFDPVPNSYLGIDCDIQLCIATNADKCYLPCWGGSGPATGTEAPTTSAFTLPSTESTSLPTTTTTPGFPFDTTTTTQSIFGTETTPTTTAVAPEPFRMKVRFQPRSKRDTGNLGDSSADPDSTNEKTLFKVYVPGVDDPNQSTDPKPVCDSSLLSALYAVIGILAALVAVLVLTLSYLLLRRRSAKGDHGDRIHDGPYIPALSR